MARWACALNPVPLFLCYRRLFCQLPSTEVMTSVKAFAAAACSAGDAVFLGLCHCKLPRLLVVPALFFGQLH